MRQLAYISSSAQPQTTLTLTAIARASQLHNRADGITGLLFANGGWFFQVIEGPSDEIGRTFERICADSRHSGLTVLLDRQVARRSFDLQPLVLTLLGDPDSSILLSRLFVGVRSVLRAHFGGSSRFERRVFGELEARGIRHG